MMFCHLGGGGRGRGREIAVSSGGKTRRPAWTTPARIAPSGSGLWEREGAGVLKAGPVKGLSGGRIGKPIPVAD